MQTPGKEFPYFPPRLMNALAGICNSPATVVSAPSGAGKTTAVREFLSRRQAAGSRVLWYTAFGESPDTAWKHICVLLSEVDPRTASLLLKLGFPVRQTLSLLARMVSQLQCSRETILVVDNSKIFNSDIAYELVRALSHHGCEQYHLVVISQVPLEPPMYALRAEGVLFLDADVFFFREEDIDAYFRQNGVELTAEQVQQVERNSFGWAAVVRLQLLGYRQTGQIQIDASIYRLMRTALWGPMSDEEKRFLLLISRMERVDRRQAGVLLGCGELPEYAAKLLERGGFIQYDLQSRTYAVHSLLRQFLDHYFEELSPEEKQPLYARIGRAHLLADAPFAALRMLLLAGEYEEMLAVPLTNRQLAEYDTGEVMALLRELLDACPPELLQRHPVPLLRFAFEAMLRGDGALYARCCAIVNQALKDPEAFSAEERRYLRGEYTFLRSFSVGNDLVKIHAAHKAAFKALGGPSSAFDSRWSWTFDAPSILAAYWSDLSPIAETLELSERNLPIYLALSRGHGAGAVELMRAELLLNAGQLDDAEALCHKARYLAGETCQDGICFSVTLVLGRIAVLRGDATQFAACLAGIDGLMLTSDEKTRHQLADQCFAALYMALGRTGDVPPWLQNAEEIRRRMFRGGASYGMMLLGRYLLLQKDYNQLVGLAGPVLQMAESQHILLTQVYYLLYLACAKRAANKPEDAQYYLQRALDIALPERIYLPFAEHMAELEVPFAVWKNTRASGRQAAAIQHLARLYRTGAERINRKLYGASLTLTPREAEIARYTKQGLSNKQIAETLYISPETVKKTLKNVFSKLGVKSRRQLEDYEFN